MIQNLHAKPGFTAADGWELRLWEKELELPNGKKQLVKQTYKRWYIIHGETGDVITCQNKAWMDSVGCVMRCD